MPDAPLDYASAPLTPRRTPPIERVGQTIAMASLALPFITFGIVASFGLKTLAAQAAVENALLPTSVVFGIVALSGIPWWGDKHVWVRAVLGIVFSASWFYISRYSPPFVG